MCCASTRAEARPRRRLSRACAALLFAGVFAAHGASAQGSRIHMHGEGPYAADGLLFMPSAAANNTGLLVVPGAAGITAAVQAAAQSFSAAGYEVVVLDPNRSGPPDPARSDDETWADVNAALAYFGAQSNLRAGAIGVLGIGRGARFALRLASAGRVQAVAIEGPAETLPQAAEPRTPLLASLSGSAPASRSAAGRKGAATTVRYYASLAAAPADGDQTFNPADLEAVRGAELEFLGRHLPAH